MKNLFFILILATLFGCSATKLLTDDYYEEDKDVNLFAFVGKKISVIEFDPNAGQIGVKVYDSISGDTIIRKQHIMDGGYRCKYVIVKNIFNNPKVDTLDFVAYDHYGSPAFSKYETVLLYVSKSSKGSQYFHQKYQFDYLERNNDEKYYGYTYDKKQHLNQIVFINKKIASLEELLKKKKDEVFKSLFNEKSSK